MRRLIVPSLGVGALVGGLGFGPAHCAGPRAAEARARSRRLR